jgi:hypothetical protein
VEVVAGGTAADHLDRADFHEAVTEMRFEASGFGIENNLPHATVPFDL